ncbi:MAG: DUF3429 domain-containing protein [Hoeflea sp.]|uniref:DUF3429 domain-containing protein n=1 Tax=Hoeflea sp. TaxID=1940281 RepID=UPI0032EA910D
MTSQTEQTRLTATAWFLAGFGAVPFAAMALAGAMAPGFAATYLGGEAAFTGYGAVILSFMGGIRWGAVLTAAPGAGPSGSAPAQTLIVSVAPSLAGWLALLIERPWSLLLLLAAFVAQGVWDVVSASRGGLPEWFGRLRLVISAIVAASILLILLV